jgi:hypothetical protein
MDPSAFQRFRWIGTCSTPNLPQVVPVKRLLARVGPRAVFLVAAGCGNAFIAGGDAVLNDAAADAVVAAPNDGDGAAGDGSLIGQNQACGDRAHANCLEIQTCSAEVLTTTYGDEGTCETRLKLYCLNALAAGSIGNNAAHTEACGQAFSHESCSDFFDLNPQTACVQPKGSLSNGKSCALPGQCESGFCAIVPGSACGLCADAPMPGDPCDKLTTCGQTLACVNATKQCQAFALQGAACGSGSLCGADLFCVGASSTAQGTCQPAVEQAGSTCDPQGRTGAGCDRIQGLTCNSVTKQCAPLVFAAAGQPCGANVGDQFAACANAATCTPQGGEAGAASVCVPTASDGAACDLALGPGCLEPARCIVTDDAGTRGTCQFPDTRSCP